jgi:hypothetical protein
MQTQKTKAKASEAETEKLLMGLARREVGDNSADLKLKAAQLDEVLGNQVFLIASVVGHLLAPYLNEKTGLINTSAKQPALDGVGADD